jgi:23S rRNA (guanosine2251-2'-O)-methyltransferase
MDKKQFIFGTRAVIEAIRAGRDLDKIFIQSGLTNDLIKELIQLARDQDVSFTFVPAQKLSAFPGKNHQGVVAALSAVHFESLENIVHNIFSAGRDPFILVLDRITDVRNFGAIVRSAEAAGIDAIVIPEKGNAPVSADAMKTSAGALNYVPVCRSKDLKQSIKELRNSGLRVVACTEKAEELAYNVPMAGPLALIMGSEEDGIAPEILRQADELVKIPMQGKIQSLNVSVAAGIMLFEAVRQRTAGH